MKEIDRQLVAFGNFKSIDFGTINELNDIIKEYSFTIEAAQDFPTNDGVAQDAVKISITQTISTVPQIRPVLFNKDRTINIFFGSNRLHIEEINADSLTYDVFLQMGKKILNTIINRFGHITINRIAINGKLISEDEDVMNAIYSNTFKSSKWYGDKSQEYSFRINTITDSPALKCKMNKIIAINRTHQIQKDKPLTSVMLIDYDYNTVENKDAEFNYDAFGSLIEEGSQFRLSLI